MGLATPAAMVAMIARRYMHVSGATSEDFGLVTVADRRHAASNPKAWFFGRPVTLAEHRHRGRSPSRSGCSTAARRAMAPSPSWSQASTARAACRSDRP